MTLQEFTASVRERPAPPSELSSALQSLWWAKRGDWERAHTFAQEIASSDGSWVHAYLHRVEGDAANAGYWYARAGRPAASGATDDEWEEIASSLLGN